ncbi:MAG: hypothetical protein HY296_02715 [Thaumarchaeota archaeon]|nr:hypothetical protein [Nitrososphaerota archaeon]
MGRSRHLGNVRALIGKTPAFRARDAELIVGDRAYAMLLLHHLAKKGEVHRITRGWYSKLDDPVVSVFAFRPAYLGLQEALSLHGLWEQETNVVLVTTLKVRTGPRTMMGSRVVVHRIDGSRFFGLEYLRYDGFFVPVSDVEKTLIDLVYFRASPGQEAIEALKKRVDRRKLNTYLREYTEGFGKQVLRTAGLA